MAYEYEGYIKNTIRTEAVFSHEIEQKHDRILELQEVYRKAKAFDGIYKFLSNSPIEPFFKEYLERIANELEDAINDSKNT